MNQHRILSNFLFDYREYINSLKGKQKIEWYMIISKRRHFSTWSKINSTTFNKICLVLLNDMTKSKTKHNQLF